MLVRQWRFMTFVEKAAKRLSTAKSQVADIKVPTEQITKKINEVIVKYVDTSSINLSKLIDGSSVNRPTVSNTTAIQDPLKTVKWISFKSDIKKICFFIY